MINPYARIRELEREIEHAQLGRLKAEDEARLYHAQLVSVRESESQARKDWMDLIAKLPLFQQPTAHTQAPPPTRRPVMQGSQIEKDMLAKWEKDLEIAASN